MDFLGFLFWDPYAFAVALFISAIYAAIGTIAVIRQRRIDRQHAGQGKSNDA